MIKHLLIANRGEIACRIILTARAMGIETFAIYTPEDAQALHVQQADRAVQVDNYLDIQRILQVAKKIGAEAIHPGYGFLSENVQFVKSCQEAGVIFIGPSPESMQFMGSKPSAKAIAERVLVPVIPGYNGKNQDPLYLQSQAEQLGFPVMIKASHGGGGKGMRRVEKQVDFQEALASCQREAQSVFGNSDVLLEKLIHRPRHIEVQIFGDSHGNVVHLFERDCSVQRRYQKIIEEAPACGIPKHVKAQMYDAAVKIAQVVNYVGAGTVEFLLDVDQTFYFMEMNTRLQVEHPVTEEITGIDLIEWQLQVAAGEKLPLNQKQITQQNHAIEIRIYTEDPQNNFLPSAGELSVFRPPASSYRLETSVEEGSQILTSYDPMIAKLIVVDEGRKDCHRRACHILKNWPILGVQTNLGFLQNLLNDSEFTQTFVDVGFIDRNLERWIKADEDYTLFARCAAILKHFHIFSGSDCDPWSIMTGWRINGFQPITTAFEVNGQNIEVSLVYDGEKWWVDDADWVQVKHEGAKVSIRCSKAQLKAYVAQRHENQWDVWLRGKTASLTVQEPLYETGEKVVFEHSFISPVTAKVVVLDIRPGDNVTQGQRLMVLEAMKVEQSIRAPRDGKIDQVFYAVGDIVNEGAVLFEFEEGNDDTSLAQAS